MPGGFLSTSNFTLFLALQQKIQDVLPDFTYIDQDLGQLNAEKSGARLPVSWPCLLIDFEEFLYTNLAENVQCGNGTILLKLGFAPYANSAGNTPEDVRNRALAYYRYEAELQLALQGWAPADDFGALCRISARTQHRNDKVRVRELRYSIAFEDNSTQQHLRMVSVTPVYNINMDIQ